MTDEVGDERWLLLDDEVSGAGDDAEWDPELGGDGCRSSPAAPVGVRSCGCGAIAAAFHDQQDAQHDLGDLVCDAYRVVLVLDQGEVRNDDARWWSPKASPTRHHRRQPVSSAVPGGCVTITPAPAVEPGPGRTGRVEAVLGRLLAARGGYSDATVTTDIRVPMRDGVDLLADHHVPGGVAVGTVLIRSPYGAGPLFTGMVAGPYLAAGHHVVVQRCRGTFGSGGRFEPMVHEVHDGADTVAWLREQPWFGGRFATVGPSYLGFVQWGLLMDPPPELAAAIIQVGPHDFHNAVYAGGAFALNDFLGWTDLVSHQEGTGLVGAQLRALTATRRQSSAMAHLPVADAAEKLVAGTAPWYRDWASHRDPDDPFWDRDAAGRCARSRAGAGTAADRLAGPVPAVRPWRSSPTCRAGAWKWP